MLTGKAYVIVWAAALKKVSIVLVSYSVHYEQQEMGKSVSRSNLRTGDLVLFRAGSTGRHVGIYIGNNQFVHASTSSGVIISSMNEPYWKKRYNEARRVLSRS